LLKQDTLKHLAIIMDGNGRWALHRKHKRIFGHLKGAKTAREIIEECCYLKIPYLSLFALSTENLLRPKAEIQSLVILLQKVFYKYTDFLMKKKIKFHILGDVSFLPPALQTHLKQVQDQTKNHKGLNLIIALNYGGRQEIVYGAKVVFQKIQSGKLQLNELGESEFASALPSSQFPAPDLIIRTGGTIRLSNFYLWSSAYSEFCFLDVLWPDFNKKHLHVALEKYLTVERKFGVL